MSRAVTTRVLIDGIETPVREFHTVHDVDQPIATGSLTLSAPRASHVDLDAPVDIYAGYDGATSLIFSGRIATDDAAFSESGGMLRVELEGHGKRLWYAQHTDMVIVGQNTLRRIFVTLCDALGVSRYFADTTTNPDGTNIYFGGQAQVDGGNIIVKRDQSAGQLLDRIARLYGYRTFDRNDGFHRLQKISGLPVGTVSRAYTQGINILDVSQRRRLDDMANYWEVIGARYSSSDGLNEYAVRSIPLEVPFDARFGPTGVRRLRVDDGAIVTNTRAGYVRNVYEIDRSTPNYRWAWTGTGDPEMMPGQVVSVTSPTVGTGTRLWLMRVAHDSTESGWTTSMEGWAGAGTALPAGDDCVTQTLVGSTGFHIGNEYLAHYRTPNPAGLTQSIAFSVAADYSTLTIRGFAHGANSFSRNVTSTASKFEIWQPHDTERAVASGEFPRQNENLEQRLDYTIDANWSAITIPLSGSMKTGSATLKIISGYDSAVGDYDDFECKDISLVTCGVGVPAVII